MHELRGLGLTVRGHGRLLGYLRRDLTALTERVEDMTEAEKLVQAVASGIASDRATRWTRWRKLATAAAGTLLLVPALHDLATWLWV